MAGSSLGLISAVNLRIVCLWVSWGAIAPGWWRQIQTTCFLPIHYYIVM
ncbi:hypothetical protein [Oscillatoria sp. HE19RPO]|nr:hypothetical protein [Oscillatoria sp. HE19RPO]